MNPQRTKEEIIAEVLGWESFSPGPVMADTDDFLKAMEEYRQSSPVESKWVSVKERLPEDGQRVLVHGLGGRMVTAIWKEHDPVGDFLAYSYFTEELETAEEITHWQPLPELPPI